jgi:hypothetical protein
VNVLDSLEHYGLLLFSDPTLPSLVAVVVGEPVRGSWMVHPLGHAIYAAMSALDDDPSVLTTKLITGKVTYVHRRLWPAVLAVGTSREAWQMDGLSPGARWLLSEVDAAGEVVTDGLAPPVATRKRVADLARELERRVLVHSTEVHTPHGSHAKVLEPWQRWATRVAETGKVKVEEGRRQLEAAAGALGPMARLPWT